MSWRWQQSTRKEIKWILTRKQARDWWCYAVPVMTLTKCISLFQLKMTVQVNKGMMYLSIAFNSIWFHPNVLNSSFYIFTYSRKWSLHFFPFLFQYHYKQRRQKAPWLNFSSFVHQSSTAQNLSPLICLYFSNSFSVSGNICIALPLGFHVFSIHNGMINWQGDSYLNNRLQRTSY